MAVVLDVASFIYAMTVVAWLVKLAVDEPWKNLWPNDPIGWTKTLGCIVGCLLWPVTVALILWKERSNRR